MKQRALIGLGLIGVGLGFVVGAGRRGADERRCSSGSFFEDPLFPEPFFGDAFFRGPLFGSSPPVGARTDAEIEAAPLLVLRGAFNDVSVVAGDGPQILVNVPDRSVQGFVTHRIDDGEGLRVVVDLHPRVPVQVTAPRGTAVQLRFVKSRIAVSGIDDVEVHSAKGDIMLSDIAGTVRINSVMDSAQVAIAHERETSSVNVLLAKSRFALTVPAARGGDYRITAANSSVVAPPSAEGGIPVTIGAARSKIAISAG